MKANHLILTLFVLIIFNTKSYAQEGLPIYSDYLTDNFYLLYPSMAGAFLNACIFYEILTNKKAKNLIFSGKLDPKTSKIIKNFI